MKILFVCTGNTCRSPMAEGIFNELKKDLDIEVLSAGIAALDGSEVSDYAIKSMEEIHDISYYRSKLVTRQLLDQSDLILTMTKIHKNRLINKFDNIDHKIYLLNEYAFGREEDIADPIGGSLYVYEEVLGQIYEAIEKIIEKLRSS